MTLRWDDQELQKKLKDNKDLSVRDTIDRSIEKSLHHGHKYHVATKEKRTYNGQVFHSKKEAVFAQRLDLLIAARDLDFYLRQVGFPLPGGTSYRIDFVTFARQGEMWLVRFIEVKGFETRLGLIKRRQVEALYKIIIEVV